MKLKFRAECNEDVDSLIDLLTIADEIQFVQVMPCKDIPDVTVIIETKTFNKTQVIAIMKCIVDAHVMYETIEIPFLYTGYRS